MTEKEIDGNVMRIQEVTKRYNSSASIPYTTLTTPNEPDSESTGQVRNTSEKITASNELARSFPLLLILRIPSMQLDLGKLPSLRVLGIC